MKDGGGYAFPSEHPYPEGGPGATKWYTGMTLRQWYKGMALQGMLAANDEIGTRDPTAIIRKYAGAAGQMADAVIAEDKEAEKGVEDGEE